MGTNTTLKLGRPPKHPWAVWLGQEELVLVRGEDFDCEPYSMAMQLRRAAKSESKVVSVTVERDKVTLLSVENA